MEVILTEDVKHLGHKDDLVKVKAGYARNYLLPTKKALLATPSQKSMWKETLAQKKHKLDRELEEAQQLGTELGQLTLEIKTKSSKSGSIYGAITPTQVSQALKEKEYIIAAKDIHFDEAIKSLGEHQATIHLHKKVAQKITLLIAEE